MTPGTRRRELSGNVYGPTYPDASRSSGSSSRYSSAIAPSWGRPPGLVQLARGCSLHWRVAVRAGALRPGDHAPARGTPGPHDHRLLLRLLDAVGVDAPVV